MANPYEGLQDFVAQVPEWLQPLFVALAGAVPYIEGEGSAALGIIAGVNPIVAGLAGATGNIICVILVVLLSSRIREAAVARRGRASTGVPAAAMQAAHASNSGSGSTFGGSGTYESASSTQVQTENERTVEMSPDTDSDGSKKSKGRTRLRRWIVKFGVPGASLIAPLALPTQLTAATLVASGVNKGWVILWQVIAIVLWTTAVTLVATGVLNVLVG